MTGFELVKFLSHNGVLYQEIYIGTRKGDIISRLYEEDVGIVYADDTQEGDVVMILI